MTRREILKYTSLLTGTAIAAPLMTSVLSGCHEGHTAVADYEPQFFSSEDFSFLTELIDVILPKSDSPAASEVGVHQLIDKMVAEVYDEPAQKAYQEQFSALKNGLADHQGDDLLTALNNLLTDTGSASRGALLTIKQQTVAYYLSTEEVSMNFLNYLPVPGEYEGCITTESVGNKAWA
jgi:hypothetical protein